MAWIESHDDLRDHPKLRRLCRALEINRAQAIGHLHLLWWWTMKYFPDGDLSECAPDEIAEGAGWMSDPVAFVSALVSSGFADPVGEVEPGVPPPVRLHDWEDYGEKLHRRRQADAERKRERRQSLSAGRPQDIPATSEGHPQDVPETSAGRPLRHDMTRHDMTRHEESTYMPGSCAENSFESDPFDDESPPQDPQTQAVKRIFEHYKAKIQPQARICPVDKIRARLRRFSEEEILAAIDHFSADRWCMEHNGNRGAPWFFHSDARIEQYLLKTPGKEERRNGKHRDQSRGHELSDECLEYIRQSFGTD